jgi:antitoxin component YwqK of YwqJK toxin-antitoxin module
VRCGVKVHTKNDLEQGRWKTWYENGKLLNEGDFVEGKEHGDWIQNWDNGKRKK